jgi:hypothetical protein
MIGVKQVLGAIAVVLLLFAVMFYTGMFMHGDRGAAPMSTKILIANREAAE